MGEGEQEKKTPPAIWIRINGSALENILAHVLLKLVVLGVDFSSYFLFVCVLKRGKTKT